MSLRDRDRSRARGTATVGTAAGRTAFLPAGEVNDSRGRPYRPRYGEVRVVGLPAPIVEPGRVDTNDSAARVLRGPWYYVARATLSDPATAVVDPDSGGVMEVRPEADGQLVFQAPEGETIFYASDRPLSDPRSQLPAANAVPRWMRRFVVNVNRGETATIDAAIVAPPAPARSGPGILGINGLPEGWTVWLADPMVPVTRPAEARDYVAGLQRVGTSLGASGSLNTFTATVNPGTWNNGVDRQIQVRSPDGSLRVDYVGEVTIATGNGTVINMGPALSALSGGAGGAPLTLVNVPPGWDFRIDGVSANGTRVMVPPGTHRVQGFLAGWDGVATAPAEVLVDLSGGSYDARRAVQAAGLGALIAGQRAAVDAINLTLSGSIPAPRPAPAQRVDDALVDQPSVYRAVEVPSPTSLTVLPLLTPPGWFMSIDKMRMRANTAAVEPGPHIVQFIRADDGFEIRRDITAEAGKMTTVDLSAELAAALSSAPTPSEQPAVLPGAVVVSGVPADWPIGLDGTVVPAEALGHVPAGRHVVAVRTDRGVPLALTVDVVAGQTAVADFSGALAAALAALPGATGAIELSGVNPGDGLYLDAQRLGAVGEPRLAAALAAVPTGAHVLGLERHAPSGTSLPRVEQSVTVMPGRVATVQFPRASETTGPEADVVRPANASVGALDIRGVPVEAQVDQQTPSASGWGVKLDGDSRFDPRSVPPGAHTVELWQWNSGVDVATRLVPAQRLVGTRSVTVLAGQVVVVDFTADVAALGANPPAVRPTPQIPPTLPALATLGGPHLLAANQRRFPAAKWPRLQILGLAPDGRVQAALGAEALAALGFILAPDAGTRTYTELDVLPLRPGASLPHDGQLVAVFVPGQGMSAAFTLRGPLESDGTFEMLVQSLYRNALGQRAGYRLDHPTPQTPTV